MMGLKYYNFLFNSEGFKTIISPFKYNSGLLNNLNNNNNYSSTKFCLLIHTVKQLTEASIQYIKPSI